jgi:Zn-dependent peptidase ImmA (M78 family)
MTSSVEKGDKLEDDFYRYLLDQKDQRELVYGIYPPELCEIFKKKSYPCSDRGEDVEFDVVVELRGEGRVEPHMHIVFECKNYKNSVPELYVRDFSDKLKTVFGHSAKGILVSSTRLQSGAEKVARKRKMGIAKYDKCGIEIVADRKGRSWADKSYLKSQFFKDARHSKSLKFSAYHDGKYFSSFSQLLSFLDTDQEVDGDHVIANSGISVPYLSDKAIKTSAEAVLEKCEYAGGAVDLVKICEMLSIDLSLTEQKVRDEIGNPILGSANFDRKTIEINFHKDERQKRFTIGHELGHFCLDHGRFLRSESIIANDLLLDRETDNNPRYERLEFQANKFAAELILPEFEFRVKTEELRRQMDIRNKGHGYIYVDDQSTNLQDYFQLLFGLKAHFDVSSSAIEIRFKKLGMLTDQRTKPESTRISSYLTTNACDA